MKLNGIFVIMRLTFFEASRRKILLAALAFGLLFLVVYAFGLRAILTDISREGNLDFLLRNEILNFLSMAGFYAINFLTIMLSVLTSVDTLSGEISSGTALTILAKPIQRWELVLGKWLGFAVLVALYILIMCGGVVLVVLGIGDYVVPNFLAGMAFVWLNGLLVLTISLCGGAFLSTLANGVLVFGLFGVAFVGGWIEQIGVMVQNTTAVNIGIVTSLLMPSEAIWRRSAFLMQSPLVKAVGFSPFTSGGSAPSPLMVWYAIAYAAVLVYVAIRIFRKRDL